MVGSVSLMTIDITAVRLSFLSALSAQITRSGQVLEVDINYGCWEYPARDLRAISRSEVFRTRTFVLVFVLWEFWSFWC